MQVAPAQGWNSRMRRGKETKPPEHQHSSFCFLVVDAVDQLPRDPATLCSPTMRDRTLPKLPLCRMCCCVNEKSHYHRKFTLAAGYGCDNPLSVWLLGIWNWFVGGMCKSLVLGAREALRSCKQNLMEHSGGVPEEKCGQWSPSS